MARKAKTMSAGQLTELITIEKPSIAGDGMGGRQRGWAQHTQAWAEIEAVSAAEGGAEGAERSTATYHVRIYRDPSITAEMRVRWGTTALNIREVPMVPAHDLFMVIVAESGVPGTE